VELQHKLMVVSLVAQHLRMVLWFIEGGLLPENEGMCALGWLLPHPGGSEMEHSLPER
jgi:hypothetical protein